MNNHIAISLPITSGKIKENIKIIKRALINKPNYIELRFDYIDDLDAINEDLIRPLLKIIEPKSSSIFTFRHIREGGRTQIGEKKRLKILKELICLKPNYLDIEIEIKDEDLSRIVGSAINEEVNLIFSHHNLKNTPIFIEVQNNIKKFIIKLEDKFNLNSDSLENYVFKMIFTADKLADNLVPLKLCSEFNNDYNIVSFCIGKEGIFSRVFCLNFGSFFTYGSLEKKTASGQIKIEKIRKIHQLLLDL